ncbi:PREDICTED: uncharacterized protein LOC107070007 [Polistes dominula]|uniref:Uncharacterized protein LOC107070007 n=1 Tax=Polistes dominula TaxID=743375 RepID=A0ABM1ISU3_POLDO|nr:PREDICTED: uncharacterized protein LOC107070007 [Polistes dominula]
MKGGLLATVAFAATLVTVFAVDTPILPIPTRCPDVDSDDATVHIRHETDCTKFYKCLDGEKILMDCPYMNKAKTRRLHFNALYQVCDFPSKANCTTASQVSKSTPSGTVSWDPSWTCSNTPVGTNLPHETRCYLFYQCTANGKQLQECPEGKYFNPYSQVCDNSDRCPITTVCKNYKGSEGKFFPDPVSCKNVYYCKGFKTAVYTCDEEAEWSVQFGKCMSINEANCSRKLAYYNQ